MGWGVGAGGVGCTLTTYAHKMVKVDQTLHKGGQYDRLGLPGVLYFIQFHNDGVFLRSTTQSRHTAIFQTTHPPGQDDH